MSQNTEKKKLFQTAFLKRQQLLLSRRAAQKERKHIGYGAVVLWVLFFGALLYSLFFSPWLIITKTEIIGESVVPRPLLESFLEENLSGKKFFIFSRRQLLVVSEREMERRWLERFPKFESVTLERSFPHELRLRVTEKPLLIRWCSGGPCFLLDEAGHTKGESYVDEPYYAPYVFTIVEKSATPVHRGEVLETISYSQTIKILVEQLTPMTSLVMDQTFETPTRHARELRVRVSEGWDLLLNTETFSSATLENLERLLREKIPPEKRVRLLAIDVRTDGKAFVAYRDIPTETVTTEEPVPPEKEKTESKKDREQKKN